MLSDNLFQSVLVDPIKLGANRLHVVAGYATAAMAFHHLNHVQNRGIDLKLDLIVGMCPYDGLSISNHNGFKKLVQEDLSDKLRCSYIMAAPAVHSKVYIWTKNEKPVAAFAGSANYTQSAFRHKQREVMVACEPQKAYDYYQQLLPDTILCTHNEAESVIQIVRDNYEKAKRQILGNEEEDYSLVPEEIAGLPKVTFSLLANNGTLPRRSGLNWGQRPEYGRNPNQAYLRLPASIYHSDFFPENTVHFTVLTDDGKAIICTRAQQNGKAIHTPHNNSLLGEYFRYRLGLASGAIVTEADLQKYGRSELTFYKIDDETFYMDFSA